MIKKIVWAVGLFCCVLVSCKKETETLPMTAISEYVPLVTGKYITYQLDSFRYLRIYLVFYLKTYNNTLIGEWQISE